MARRSTTGRGIYQRGPYWLDWDRKANGTKRSPFLTIFWYDAKSGRIRSASTRTTSDREGRDALDRHYLRHTTGHAICPTCGQLRNERSDYFVTDAIADYLLKKQDKTLNARLAHVVQYIGTLPSAAIHCRQIDEEWAENFRKWAAKEPVILSTGQQRLKPRSASTIENSLIQLAAAINAAKRRGDVIHGPQFKSIPTTQLNQTPTRRLTVVELAQAFTYATDPQYRHKRANLHAFLMAAVSTAARPDALYDISTAPERAQWNATFGVLELNPKGRRQTKKYRASLRVPWQFAVVLDRTKGFLIPVKSVRTAFDQMCGVFGWPKDHQNGQKLIRRSIAQLLRDPARGVPTEQLEILLGHRRVNSTTDIYAPFDPAYLRECKTALEGVIAEIEELSPGAFHRSSTGAALPTEDGVCAVS